MRSHTSRVVDDLGLAIVSGRQPEGSLLPGDGELIERYGVSRTVLREALKTLSAKGLVQAKARIGTRVRDRAQWNLFDPDVLIWHARTGFTPEFLQHLGEMRMALEPEAAALAARRRTAGQLAEIEGWLEQMADPDILPQEFVRADLGLHLAVAAAAGNPFFLSISTLIEVVLVAMLTISSPAESPTQLAISVVEHKQVADAIRLQDSAAARRAMQAVVQKGIDNSRT
ncbi:MAG: FadR family transcriptional regulator [Devosia nanyangense]|uniref:FadR family transcriptional regulator n=1 Tax=Devosia nanyangense TaxID=1228055 RepID=A0A933L5Z3_9HYPH|nr:FadR family transcriptional regulator [Devosia nanyangense]